MLRETNHALIHATRSGAIILARLMLRTYPTLLVMLTVSWGAQCAAANQPAVADGTKIPVGARVYVVPTNGFETYLLTAIHTRGVPVVVVSNRGKAEFEIKGTADSKGDIVQSTTTVTNLRTGVVAFSYSYEQGNMSHGKQSAAEAFAKRLKQKINGR
jgi:hypothetical protein